MANDPAQISRPSRKTERVPYSKLLKLAPKLKPPQNWYEESVDPFKKKAEARPSRVKNPPPG